MKLFFLGGGLQMDEWMDFCQVNSASQGAFHFHAIPWI